MARKDFKTWYKTEYSSMGILINEIFPYEVKEMLTHIKMLEVKDTQVLGVAIGWLAANMPPYKLFFKKYDDLKLQLKKCRDMYLQWKKEKNGRFPSHIYDEIYNLYEQWWEAYNDSGAGIKGYAIDPQEKRKLYDAVVGRVSR